MGLKKLYIGINSISNIELNGAISQLLLSHSHGCARLHVERERGPARLLVDVHEHVVAKAAGVVSRWAWFSVLLCLVYVRRLPDLLIRAMLWEVSKQNIWHICTWMELAELHVRNMNRTRQSASRQLNWAW